MKTTINYLKKVFPFLALLLSVHGFGQPSQAARDSINKITQADYDQMLTHLGLKRSDMRPGPSGNPSAPNAANRFEDRVNQYTLPDPLTFKNGRAVRNAADWQKRRLEIAADFEREIYGRLPENVPSVRWEVVSFADTVIGNLPIKEKRLKGVVDNSSYPSLKVEIEFLVATPAKAEGPVPIVIEFGWTQNPFNRAPVQPIGLGSSTEPTWKEQLIMRGWSYGILVPGSIQADHGAGLTQGIIGLVNKGNYRKPDDWGSLRAWAWGASRAIDYLETDKDIDSKRVAIEGLSRYGKAALVAMAFEP
ncbi:MAG TPA: acetylxylan esterase, partial [Chryseosolibacter sp.]